MTPATSASNQSQSTQNSNATKETQNNSTNNTTRIKHKSDKKPITHSLIEQCVNLYRKRCSHRNVRDFDRKYLKIVFMKEVLEEMSSFPKLESS